jgi:hypothetical protein
MELSESYKIRIKQLAGIITEVHDSDYLKWKRKNVTLRGMQTMSQENNAGAMLGNGLYSASLGNKTLAKKYGKVYFAVNARPKNPIVFNTLNHWEIWFQGNLLKPYSYNLNKFNEKTNIENEIQKLGYDGIEIKGREMVNFSPGNNVMYFENEQDLENYYIYNVKNTLSGLNSLYEAI